MERFVQFVVAGGLSLVAGLWVLRVYRVATGPGLVGLVLVALGVGGLARGIWSQVEY